jgi:hypothetical protein
MSDSLPEFEIKVRPSPETGDHEVCLLAGGLDLVELFAPGLMGLDPGDLLVEPCSLFAEGEAHRAVIGRCSCGVIGCGSVEVNIQRADRLVSWTETYSARSVQFDAAQYCKEVERALCDYSWESPERTAGRFIAREVDRLSLAKNGFEFRWASGGTKEGMMTVSLELNPGPYQVLISLPWDGKDIDGIVRQFTMILRQGPESWPEVDCHAQVGVLGLPPFSGPGWH